MDSLGVSGTLLPIWRSQGCSPLYAPVDTGTQPFLHPRSTPSPLPPFVWGRSATEDTLHVDFRGHVNPYDTLRMGLIPHYGTRLSPVCIKIRETLIIE